MVILNVDFFFLAPSYEDMSRHLARYSWVCQEVLIIDVYRNPQVVYGWVGCVCVCVYKLHQKVHKTTEIVGLGLE